MWNLQANVAKPFLSVVDAEATNATGADFAPLKLPYAIDKPVDGTTVTRLLLRHHSPATARSRTHRDPPPAFHVGEPLPEHTGEGATARNKKNPKSEGIRIERGVGLGTFMLFEFRSRFSNILKGEIGKLRKGRKRSELESNREESVFFVRKIKGSAFVRGLNL